MATSTPRYGYPIIEANDHVRSPATPAKLATDVNRVSIRAESVAASLDEKHTETATQVNAVSTTADSAKQLAQSAQTRNVAQDQTLESQDQRIRAIETLGSVSPGSASDATVASLVAQHDSQTSDALESQFQRKGELFVSPKDFGAVGDGITDDTTALQAWLDAPGRVRRLDDGTYRITATLVSAEDHREIFSDGAVIIADTNEMVMLRVQGKQTRVKLHLDGNHKARGGLQFVAGLGDASGSTVVNMHSEISMAYGVRAETNEGFTCVRASIHNIHSEGNDTLGDGNGASRGIQVTSTLSAVRESLVLNNYISNITGEEGDAIHVLFSDSDSSTHFLDGLVTIRGNIISNATRRAIKVQSSRNHVDENYYDHNLADQGLEHAIIFVLNSTGNTVRKNHLRSLVHPIGISVTADFSHLAGQNQIVTDNHVEVSTDATQAIFLNQQHNMQTDRNHMVGGTRALIAGNCHGGTIRDNTETGGIFSSTSVGYEIYETCSKLIVRGNITTGGERRHSMRPACVESIVEHNHSMISAAGNFDALGRAEGTLFSGNTSRSLYATVAGVTAAQFHQNAMNFGDGSTGDRTPAMIFTRQSPATEKAGKYFSRGAIAFNSNASVGSPLGWVCVTSGTPGTWQALPTV